MDSEHTWVVRLDIEEIGNRTDAAATLFTDGLQTADARGTARKSPYDEQRIDVGDDIAAGRALIRLGEKLIAQAERELARHKFEPVYVHR